MYRFNVHDFNWFERYPTSPAMLQTKINELVCCSYNTKAKVESINPETGEYRIILQGTLDMHGWWPEATQ